MKSKIFEFWQYLNELNTSNATMFNFRVMNKAREMGINYILVDRILSAWACTLENDPPQYLLSSLCVYE